jgi:hypothetical protein
VRDFGAISEFSLSDLILQLSTEGADQTTSSAIDAAGASLRPANENSGFQIVHIWYYERQKTGKGLPAGFIIRVKFAFVM